MEFGNTTPMVSEDATPLFTSGKELADFLLMDGILSKAWELIPKDFANKENTFEKKEDGDIVFFVFPSFLEDLCPIQKENKVENKVFSNCLKGDDDQPALVHGGALNRYIALHSNFEAQMQSIINNRERKQNIILVGHSIGGVVATLATIWLLEKRETHISPFCITFGCPLVGDVRLGQAIGGQDWSGKFCHVVSQYDVIPRMLLAPVESIAEHVDAILPYWVSIMDNDSPSIQKTCRTILKNVLQYTSLFAKNDLEESSPESPYRPFATYMFCSRNGAACIEDPEAILSMLHLTMQINEGNSFDARVCVSENTCYGDVLKHIIGDLVNKRRIGNAVSDSPFEVQIALILDSIGVRAEYEERALLALRKAGEVKNKYVTTTGELLAELSENQSAMAEIEWYKTYCRSNGPGYYDLFKQQDRKDIKANLNRMKLGGFWDDVIEKEKRHELPSDFRTQNKWINAGTVYRRLVEPLDIAYHYHIKKESRSYLSIRPLRHIVLEKWLEEKQKTRSNRNKEPRTKVASLTEDKEKTGSNRDKKPRTKFANLTEDSCFWARVEESCKDLKSLQGEQDHPLRDRHKENLAMFEDYVWKMISERRLSREIFLQESSFRKWWQEYKNVQFQSPQWHANSPLMEFEIMNPVLMNDVIM